MIKIRINKPKYKEWLKKYYQRRFLKEIQRRVKRKNSRIQNNSATFIYDTVIAPTNFSIFDNTVETVNFFNYILNRIRKSKDGLNLLFEMKDIKNLTIDSIMYMLAILYNIKVKRRKNFHFKGTYPDDIKSRTLMRKSGFERYVDAINTTEITKSGQNLEIRSGNENNEQVAKEICDFVNKIFNTSIIYTKALYNIIIELMDNTCQHAYDEDNYMLNHWYVYVENKIDKIKFIFLDTGSGIPETVTKKFTENVLRKSDNEYIISALRGEFRTKTKQDNRGKGLPEILNAYKDNKIQNLAVVSGHGRCCLDEISSDFSNNFHGTLFYWELNRKFVEKELLK